MSDAYAEKSSEELPEPPAQKRSVTMTITLHPDGSLELSGPLNNKLMAFGLLGAAQAQLTNVHIKSELAQQAASRGGMNGLLRRMNGG